MISFIDRRLPRVGTSLADMRGDPDYCRSWHACHVTRAASPMRYRHPCGAPIRSRPEFPHCRPRLRLPSSQRLFAKIARGMETSLHRELKEFYCDDASGREVWIEGY